MQGWVTQLTYIGIIVGVIVGYYYLVYYAL